LLPKDVFENAVKLLPLISIDLIIHDDTGSVPRILLGKRKNEPARGCWFVPGGRVYKREILDQALARISKTEIGTELIFDQLNFLGVYEHLYDDELATHYVVHAYETNEISIIPQAMFDQHDEFIWMSMEELMSNPEVHQYTKNYFK